MSQGVTTVDNMDDGEELQVTDVSTQRGWGKTGKLWGPAGTATSTGWVGDRGGHSEPPGSSLDSPMEISGVCSWHFSQGCRSKQLLFAELNWNAIGT